MPTTDALERQTTTRPAVDVRTLLLALIVMVALLMAYVIGSAREGAGSATAAVEKKTSAAPADDGAKEIATIVMTGTGKATGVPDQMTFDVAIQSTSTDVSSALAQANATARQVLRTLRAEGVAPKDVKTTGLSIHPVYDYPDNGPAVITGYSASERMKVAVQALETAGQVLGAAAEAGGNAVRISGIKLGIADTEALMQEARADAVSEAIKKAKEYADSTGRDLGEVISVREVTPGTAIAPVPATLDSMRAVSEASSVVPIRMGRAPLQVTVAVVWSFAD